MKFDDQTYQLIHDYLLGNLLGEQRDAFENRLANEPDLAEEVEINRLMMDSWNGEPIQPGINSDLFNQYLEFLKSEEAEQYRQLLHEADLTYQVTEKRTNYIIYGIAASVLLVSFAWIFYLFIDNTNSKEIASFYQWEELPSLTERNSVNALAKAEASFKSGDYQSALTIFQEWQSKHEPDANVFIYKGVCYFELQQYDLALHTFENLANSNLLDSQLANWYLALTYLKIGNEAMARKQLKIILKRRNDPNFHNSRELLDILNEK